ncbi:unnamed protein product [Urochloa decumbens]|uniref:rRNA N-glycosylase n=1 Tax=Urochloa decumbens TaxID=240449 RepID=A0ABC9F3X1_9POAL
MAMDMDRASSSRVKPLLFLALALAASSTIHADPAAAAAAAQRGLPADGEAAAVAILQLFTGEVNVDAALAVQTHDLSLAGFSNRSGHWHAFPGHDHLLPGSTPLPFDNTYRDLIGGLANLPSLPLGRGPAAWAASVLSSAYGSDTAEGGGGEALKRALATMKVMVIEAQRLRPVGKAVAEGFDSGDARVAPEHLPYVEHWDTICYELIRALRTGKWGGPFAELLRESAGIRGEEDARAVVDLVVNRTLPELLMAHARSA